MKTFAGVVVLSLAVALPGFAGAGDTAIATVTVQTAQAIEFTPSALLLFGKVVGSSTDGTAIVEPVLPPVRTATGGAKFAGSAEFGPAAFTVSGEAGVSYFIDLPELPVQATKAAAVSPFLNVIALTTDRSPSLSGTLNGGTDTFLVGGTLAVPANLPGGEYQAEIVVGVAY